MVFENTLRSFTDEETLEMGFQSNQHGPIADLFSAKNHTIRGASCPTRKGSVLEAYLYERSLGSSERAYTITQSVLLRIRSYRGMKEPSGANPTFTKISFCFEEYEGHTIRERCGGAQRIHERKHTDDRAYLKEV